jgi:hypothetical protein
MSDDTIEAKLDLIINQHKILPKHTNFQIEHFMIGKEFTTEGKIWQCIRELSARRDTLKNINLELSDAEDNLQLIKIKIEKLKVKSTFSKNRDLEILNQKQKEILIRKCERKLQSLDNLHQNVIERKEAVLAECNKIIDIFNKLNPENKTINIDDDQNQLEYWNSKLNEEVTLSSVLGYPLSVDVVRSIIALPNTAPVRAQILSAMESQGKKMLNANN